LIFIFALDPDPLPKPEAINFVGGWNLRMAMLGNILLQMSKALVSKCV
jgi:hypothetical protein